MNTGDYKDHKKVPEQRRPDTTQEQTTRDQKRCTSAVYFLCSFFILDYQRGVGFGFDFGFILRLRN